MTGNGTNVPFDLSTSDADGSSPATDEPTRGGDFGDRPDDLAVSLGALTAAIRELVARSPVSAEELITAEQLAELFRMSPRTLRDLAASGHIPHHRIGKHYRFSRDDIADILGMTRKIPQARRTRPRVA